MLLSEVLVEMRGERLWRTIGKRLGYDEDRPVDRPAPTTYRNDVGRLRLPTLAREGGLGAELGVAAGYYSDVILSNSQLGRLYSIDAWGDHHDSEEYVQCVTRLARYGNRSVVLRMLFDDAIQHFPDDFFDFIYIDAYAHTGQQEGKILYDWWPKLKTGGIYSGHDYDESWPLTVEAVDSFARSVRRELEIVEPCVTENEHDAFASWYLIK